MGAWTAPFVGLCCVVSCVVHIIYRPIEFDVPFNFLFDNAVHELKKSENEIHRRTGGVSSGANRNT